MIEAYNFLFADHNLDDQIKHEKEGTLSMHGVHDKLRSTYKILVGKRKKKILGGLRCASYDNIKRVLKKYGVRA